MSSKHILVVESTPDDAFLLRRALKELPFCTSFLCRSLGEARAYLTVYILAGLISPQDRATLTGMGIKRVVEKPTDPRELKRVLADMAQEICGAI